MPSTFTRIATSTLNNAASSLTFTNISQAFTDLEIRMSIKSEGSSGQHVFMRVGNNTYDSGANYGVQSLYARGAPAAAVSGNWNPAFQNSFYIPHSTYITSASNRFAQLTVWLFNYSSTNMKKACIGLANTVGGNNSEYPGVELGQQMWNQNSAINQIQFTQGNGNNFSAGTSITLYGIAKA